MAAMRPGFPLILLFSGLLAALSPLSAQEPAAADASEERDWLESYYEAPDPDRFVDQMKDWAADGTLDNEHAKPALIAFCSQLLRQNRGRIREWHSELAGLTPEQQQVLHTAMLYSRTTEADELMRELFGPAYDEQKAEVGKILELPLDRRETMDMLWGYFYATGSPSAIRRIAAGFRFRDAPEQPEGVNVPEGYVPLYKELPHFAHNSIVANAARHPRIVPILRDLLKGDETLVAPEKEGIRGILEELGEAVDGPAERDQGV